MKWLDTRVTFFLRHFLATRLGRCTCVALLLIGSFSVVAHAASFGEYRDAVFSPDGSLISLAKPDGLYLIDSRFFDIEQFHPVPEGVHFLKWLPDGQRLLYVHWREGETPFYSLYSLSERRTILQFQARVRWFSFDMDYDDYLHERKYQLQESVYPASWFVAHPNAVSFSPEGEELALITEANAIEIRRLKNGVLLRSFAMGQDHIISLGYLQNPRRMWAGTLEGKVLWLNEQTGAITESVALGQESRPYEITSDRKYIVSNDEVIVGLGSPPWYNRRTNVFDTESRHINYLCGGYTFWFTGPMIVHRTFYKKDTNLFYVIQTLTDGQRYLIFHNLQSFHKKTFPDDFDDQLVMLAQPFSPDGERFLHLSNGILWLFETASLNYREVVPRQAAVEESWNYN